MTPAEFEKLRSENPAFLLYFYGEHCGVCRHLFTKVQALIASEFPRVQLIRIDAASSRTLAGQLRMLSVPGLLLFMDGRETVRANGLIAMETLRAQIRRPYDLLFGKAE
jgi:thioredoxin-like negative regulator of GroEL